MKRVGNLYDKMISLKMMEKVYAGVMKGKHHKYEPGSKAFMIRMNKDYYMAEVGRMLQERSFKPSRPKVSTRWDPGCQKFREIKAPKLFPDQFVHWAIMLQLQPIFMKGMDDWCCASIKDRGILYAKNFIERKLDNSLNSKRAIPVEKQYKYCLKMDIRKFFDNVDRDILMGKLRKKIKDKEMLDLCKKIIDSVPRKGIPLGYYTSQWFANFYLQDFDHNLREKLMPSYNVDTYVRYMDDMIILGSNKRKLQRLMNDISTYLHDNLNLELKETSSIFAIEDRDIDFIGFRFSYGKTTLRKKILRRAKAANNRLYDGKFTLRNLRSMNAYKGWLDQTDTKTYSINYLIGNRDYESSRLKDALNKQRDEYAVSSTYRHIEKISADMIKLKEETQGDDHVLIRYYKDTDSIKVVARSTFQFPDRDEYLKELEEQRNKSKNKKKGNVINNYPSAEIYFSNQEPRKCANDYNLEIAIDEYFRKTS